MVTMDDVFMNMAKTIRNPDRFEEHKGGGAIIVNPRKMVVVSSGYTGPLDKHKGDNWSFVIHAEASAIVKRTCDLTGCCLYVTHHPCQECVKLIIQSGIKKVFVSIDTNDTETKMAATKMFKANSVEYQDL